MSAAGAPAAGGVPAGRLGLALVLHINRQTEKLGLPPLEILKRMSPDRRLSLFQSVVMEALQIDHVPQLRQDSGKRAALVSLVSLRQQSKRPLTEMRWPCLVGCCGHDMLTWHVRLGMRLASREAAYFATFHFIAVAAARPTETNLSQLNKRSNHLAPAEPFQQLDLAERRRKRELAEMTAAAAKQGTSAQVIESNLAKLQQLVPGLQPNLDQMKASDWASILKDVDSVVELVIALKTAYPKVDVGRLLQRTPKLLTKPLEQVQADAQQVRALLSGVEDVDAIIDAVPYLLDPKELRQSLANLQRWFPNQDPYEVLQKNPTMLVNIEEADLEADPLYETTKQAPTFRHPLATSVIECYRQDMLTWQRPMVLSLPEYKNITCH
ncbi:hypothetical protein COO60DRAFT_1626394 [Scenedesmus sp. NREL 46B-D3]|nr:hypothetical protein COO60DRAFT_1626394 [Scenedesmus sp. NREL 46B-D3]